MFPYFLYDKINIVTACHCSFAEKKKNYLWAETNRKEVCYPYGAVWQVVPNGATFPFSEGHVN